MDADYGYKVTYQYWNLVEIPWSNVTHTRPTDTNATPKTQVRAGIVFEPVFFFFFFFFPSFFFSALAFLKKMVRRLWYMTAWHSWQSGAATTLTLVVVRKFVGVIEQFVSVSAYFAHVVKSDWLMFMVGSPFKMVAWSTFSSQVGHFGSQRSNWTIFWIFPTVIFIYIYILF